MTVSHSAASASSVKLSPTHGSSSGADNEHSRGLTPVELEPQEMSGFEGSTTSSQRSGSCGISTGTGSGDHLKMQNHEKLQVLKQRKIDLEKLLNEKNIVFDQLQRQEQQILSGNYIFDSNFLKTNSLNLRKKISATSFKLPSSSKGKCTAKERSGSVGDMEKKLRQEIIASQAHNVANADSTRFKSARSISQADYEPVVLSPSQKKMLSKRQLHPDSDNMTYPISTELPLSTYQQNIVRNPNLPVIDINRNAGSKLMAHSPMLTLSNPSHRSSPVLTAGASHSGYVGRVNASNNYCLAERRNSMKSIIHHKGMPSPKLHRQDDRLSSVLNYSSGMPDYKDAMHIASKVNRIDYDGSNSMIMPPHQGYANSNLLYEEDKSAYLTSSYVIGFAAESSDVGAQMVGDVPLSSNRLSSISASGNSTKFSKPPDFEETPYCNQRLSMLGGWKSAQHYMDVVPTKPIFSAPKSAVDEPGPIVGLGGFWKTLGNERIWCTVDTSYESSSLQPSHRSKKINAAVIATPIKSISLGNFDMLNEGDSKEELVDRISISSMNSEGNKKQKEKQWLETSLDGPLTVTTRHLNQQMDTQGKITTMLEQESSPQPSPTHRLKVNTKAGPNGLHYNNSCKLDGNPKLPRNTSNKASRSTSHCADFATHHSGPGYFSQSTMPLTKASPPAYEDAAASPALDATIYPLTTKQRSSSSVPSTQSPLNLCPSNERVQQKSPSPSYSMSSCAAIPKPSANPRSPINAMALHHDLIRIESPKNMTVVQQAVFMPYKEVTKPFEMADFYKYSTKFRQRDRHPQSSQQNPPFHQQPVEVEL